MGRALIAAGLALVLLVGGLGLAVYLTRDEDNIQVDNVLSENLTKAIALSESEQGGRVDVAEQAPFGWDHVLLVSPAATRAQISRRLGYEWTGVIGFRTGELFLFMHGAKVFRFASYRGEGRFAGFPTPVADVPRDGAVLRVRDLVVRPGP